MKNITTWLQHNKNNIKHSLIIVIPLLVLFVVKMGTSFVEHSEKLYVEVYDIQQGMHAEMAHLRMVRDSVEEYMVGWEHKEADTIRTQLTCFKNRWVKHALLQKTIDQFTYRVSSFGLEKEDFERFYVKHIKGLISPYMWMVARSPKNQLFFIREVKVGYIILEIDEAKLEASILKTTFKEAASLIRYPERVHLKIVPVESDNFTGYVQKYQWFPRLDAWYRYAFIDTDDTSAAVLYGWKTTDLIQMLARDSFAKTWIWGLLWVSGYIFCLRKWSTVLDKGLAIFRPDVPGKIARLHLLRAVGFSKKDATTHLRFLIEAGMPEDDAPFRNPKKAASLALLAYKSSLEAHKIEIANLIQPASKMDGRTLFLVLSSILSSMIKISNLKTLHTDDAGQTKQTEKNVVLNLISSPKDNQFALQVNCAMNVEVLSRMILGKHLEPVLQFGVSYTLHDDDRSIVFEVPDSWDDNDSVYLFPSPA